ncbi:hypothetical protein [Nocardia sp. NPDC056000]|uniref:hypothetical protein n=1 Tax=Nocardia sp. NPDC056000 TaxID=3345674 RepID=UPI0035DD5727
MGRSKSSDTSAEVRQQWLFERLVEEVWSNGPTEHWYELNITYVAAGSSVKMKTEASLQDGTTVLDRPLGFTDIPQQQRTLMYEPGRGTWFTQHLTISRTGDALAEYGYDEPECFPFGRADLEEDLHLYPREIVPQWIIDRSTRNRPAPSTEVNGFVSLPSPVAPRSDEQLLERRVAEGAGTSPTPGS